MPGDPHVEQRTELLHFSDVARLRDYTLRALSPGVEPTSVQLGARALSVGQSELNDVRVADASVSRFHFELARAKQSLVIRDLGSTNGTVVDGVFVIEARLRPGQRIRAGRIDFVVEGEREDSQVEAHPAGAFGALTGSSEPMRMLFAQMGRVAASDATVLLRGESGTGKELVAEEIHRHSPRRAGPFVVVDCGALPEDLIESELFGHARGAFTGATGERPGAFESAQGGTLLLDEIGELPLPLQPRLLRVLETKTVKRLGSDARRPVDVRFVAASNRNLRAEVNAGSFREDLFWRLSVVELCIPPLRERVEDIPALVVTLWQRAGLADAALPFDAEALAALARQPWRGNVRELRNYVERAAVLGTIALPERAADAPASVGGGEHPLRVDLPFKEAKEGWIDHFERRYLEARVQAAGGNLSRVAREAIIDRAHLLKLLKKHGLR